MYIGLDVGGTYVKAAQIGMDGTVGEHRHLPTACGSIDALLDQLAGVISTLRTSETAGVGAGVPGIVDRSGRVRVSPNLHILDGQGIGDELRRRTGLDVFVENDANAAALAECWMGAGAGTADMLLVTLGTGVGGGVVIGGRVWSGHAGYAGEIGHIQVDEHGVACGCGGRGHVETFAGVAGWGRLAQEALASGRPSVLRDAELLDPKAVATAAADGDAVALEVIEEVTRALGIGIAAALLLMNVERVVVGGGVSKAGELLLEPLARHVRKRIFADLFRPDMLRLALLGNDAGVIGAARVAMLEAGAREL
jgi:glucokinase